MTARALTGTEAIPPFDNSSMDGYALASAKAATAPVRLPVLGTVMAGDAPRCQTEAGAWRIMTGAPLPAGCDAVIPVERTKSLDGGAAVELLDPVEAGDYVRGKGKDFAAGTVVCPAGTRLGARHLLALAAVGVASVPVRRRPKVGLISTGRELVAPGETLAPGQIRDATSIYLANAVPVLGCEFKSYGVVADDENDFKRRVEECLRDKVDVILTTGAVSMGIADFIPECLTERGAKTLFHKVAIRPGKPVLAAEFKDGPFVFGLPGNPISTVVGLRFFFEIYLRSLLGRPDEDHFVLPLIASVDKPEGLKCFFKARRVNNGVEVLPGQASFQIHSLLSADSWAVLPEDGAVISSGALLTVYPLSEPLS